MRLGITLFREKKGKLFIRKSLSSRQDGRGHFRRTYYKGETITLKAPVTYGIWKFEKWTDRSRAKELGTNPILQLSLNSDQSVYAQYREEAYENEYSLADVISALKILVGINVNPANADADGNGKIEMKDVVYILQRLAGMR